MKSLIKKMKTKLWLAEMVRLTESNNINQLGDMLDIDTKKLLYKYASGEHTITPNKLLQVCEEIEKQRPLLKDTKSFFNIGPKDDYATNAPLWIALDGTMEEIWNILVVHDPVIALQKHLGLSFKTKIQSLIARLFVEGEISADWKFNHGRNTIAEAYEQGSITVDLHLITAVIAAWRLAHFVGSSQALLNYMMIGLLEKAMPDIFNQYGITEDLNQFLHDLDQEIFQEFKVLIDDMNYDTPMYPVTTVEAGKVVFKGYESSDAYSHWLERSKGTWVCEYLSTSLKIEQN